MGSANTLLGETESSCSKLNPSVRVFVKESDFRTKFCSSNLMSQLIMICLIIGF
jgi:hypothetical protein